MHAEIPPPGADTSREQTPQSRHPRVDTPPGADTPRADTPLGADIPLGADTPWEQTPPGSRHPLEQTSALSRLPPRADSPLGADTPQKADSSIRSMSGRSASSWNAFLFHVETMKSRLCNLCEGTNSCCADFMKRNHPMLMELMGRTVWISFFLEFITNVYSSCAVRILKFYINWKAV